MQDVSADITVDARDLMCPMPIMAASKAMRRMAQEQVLKVLATDRGSLSDIPAWVESNGHELLSAQEEGTALVFLIRKGSEI
jgi:tRNA 2-thiouridine synthesizing protein A